MKKISIFTLSIVSVMLFSGCATILGGGGSQNISVNSNKPMKAKIAYTDGSGVQYFTAPATLVVDRKSKDIIISSEDGSFNPTTQKSKLNGWFWGNIIIGGVIGSTTDFASGAAWKYDEVTNIHSNN